MWIFGEEQREDISACFMYYPQFQKDLPVLLEHEIITRKAWDCYAWNYSETSLGEYFYSIREDTRMYWIPVETAFKIKKGSLRHLVSNNGRSYGREKSKDFERIMDVLNPARKQAQEEPEKKTLDAFNEIKGLMKKAYPRTHAERRKILEKIKNILA